MKVAERITPDTGLLESLWDTNKAAGMTEPELLLYRSNLLGSDKRITNFGGGNTSAKVSAPDPISGADTRVLWVKGSGGDVGSMDLSGFATLYQDKLDALHGLYRGAEHEDEMVGYLPHCTFNLNPRAASIDTPLHAYIERKHIDHMHPDAVIAIAATSNSKALTREVYGDAIGWLPWRRPGFQLGVELRQFSEANPNAKGVVLEGHGLFTWADTSQDCYETTLEVINKAIAWFDEKSAGAPVFGGPVRDSLPAQMRRSAAARLMPLIRGRISQNQKMVGHFDDSPAVMEFVNAKELEPLAALGTSCPDHFLRTKIRPLVLPGLNGADDVDPVAAQLDSLLEAYRQDYAAYYERCRRPDSPGMRDPNPVIYLIPGVGMLSFAKDKATARIASEFYINAINVMRGASTVDAYIALDEQEAFDIEYWLLEEAKLQRMPKPKSLAGHIALVTGGAGGIGQATARRLLSEGACVVLADVDQAALDAAQDALSAEYSKDVLRTVAFDVRDEAAVQASFERAMAEYGGLDLFVSNAGISSSSDYVDTTLEDWRRNMDILATGYFLTSREAFRIMKDQGIGGSMVFIASKNALAASPGAAAYCTAKASELHLARCIALEGAELGIRVNTVNPDAVLRGSRIWQGEWREQRAAAYNMAPDALEEHYRKRSLLKRSVYPEDIAAGVYFFLSEQSAKSTGNILNVDAGNVQSFTR